MKVFDLENRVRDFQYAKDKYGVAFRRAEVAPGQKVYRLVELWEKTGHHSLITQVLDGDGNPMPDVDVAFYWVDAPDIPLAYAHDWYRNFIRGFTGGNGDVGPGMGEGAWIPVDPEPPHDAIGGGPHAVWVRDPSIPSDICEKLGMRGGTKHDHLDQKFKLTIEGGEPPMPTTGKFVEVTAKRRFDPTEATNHIAINCEEASTRNFYDTQVDLRVGEDWANPDWEDPNPHHPPSLYHYNVPADYTVQPGENERTFWVLIRHAGTEKLMGDPLAFGFETGKHGIYHVYVDWQKDSEPPPPPPPPPPSPPSGWTMAVEREAKPGARILIGKGLPVGTPVTISFHSWSTTVLAGSKPEYGPGAFLVDIWSAGTYKVSALDCEFEVEVGHNEIVTCTFIEGEPPSPQARLLTGWMLKMEAEMLLQSLIDGGYDNFSLEER